MSHFFTLPLTVRSYVIAVVLMGTATLSYSFHDLLTSQMSTQWLVLAVLILLTGSFSVKVPGINAYLSVSETFVFASVLMFGPEAGAVTVLLECLVILFWMTPDGRPVYRLLFNIAAPAVSIWISGHALFLIAGIPPYSQQSTPLSALFIPLGVFTSLYFLLNSWLVAIAVGLEDREPPQRIWWNNFIWLSVNYFSGASVAALIVTYTHRLEASTLAIIVPLLVVSYLTYRTAMGRVDDANKHLRELNRLHLSTIETLAMAIDAKDQITHGHIRRVQSYAVGLAREVGVSDPGLIGAIEAAALLHDMGKLAVPEYILNKPGRLTSAEFDKMKLHASVGADILSSIEFPYPVVPIVRHHHENWNGTGYPSGLRGTDIPIGARILSVVDCFDALTSDRPYRPRLTDQDAMAVLLERRGSMYDPLIVDTFIRVHRKLTLLTTETVSVHALNEITSAAVQSREHDQRAFGYENVGIDSDENPAFVDLKEALTLTASPSEAIHHVVTSLGRIAPFGVVILFRYDDSKDELVAVQQLGDGASIFGGLRIQLGQRLSGWVAANRQVVMNSDAALDLGDMTMAVVPRLTKSLSMPIVDGQQLVGVLTLYASSIEGYSEIHRRAVATAAGLIAGFVRQLSGVELGSGASVVDGVNAQGMGSRQTVH